MHSHMKSMRAALLGGLLTAGAAYAETIQVTAPITGVVTWSRTNEYVLNKFIYVLDGAELHIEAGTVVKAKPGRDADTSALMVAQGGKIFAEGTPTHPIIFTAEADDVTDPDDLDIFDRGLWGGVVLMGRASVNTSLDATGNAASPKYDLYEGLPDTVVNGQNVNRYGGGNDDDSSGVMRYVSIRHAGTVFQPNKELNGLTMAGVGRGTTIEFIETYATADDGYEWFGGTVNTRYLVSAFNDDDGFDTDQGWSGKNQFWFLIQEPGKKDSGGEWNGEPNGAAANNPPIANYEIYNATLIGAGTDTAGNRGLTIREYAAPKLYNSILTDFGGNAMTIDDRSKIHLDAGILDIRDNLFWGFGTNGVAVPLAGNANSQVIFTDAARNNVEANPMLRGISRLDDGGLDPRPAPGSPALTGARMAPDDGFYRQVDYKGAFGPNELWIDGWTFLSQKGFVAPRAANTVQVTEPISGMVTWSRTNEYILNKFIYVLSGAELHIEAGTVIKAKPGRDADTSAMMVTQGGKLFAHGTPTQPIIFTAEADDLSDPDDLDIYERGLWGGVVLMGRATVNTSLDGTGNAASPKYDLYEGLPDTIVNGQNVNRYGGGNDNDSSGSLRYVSIRHAGTVFQPNKELNGLTMAGVGRGTTIEFIETYATADDGYEWFGGTVNTKYLISAFNDDDGFDTDQGWSGKNQFWFLIQEPGKKDSGGEWNGEPNGAAANNPPIANYEIYNATLIGAGTDTAGNRGLTIREYAAPKLYNSILTDFGGNAMTIDDRSKTHLDAGILDIRDNLFWGFGTNGVAVPLAGNANSQVIFTDAARNNVEANPMLNGISRISDGGLDPRPGMGSPALTSGRTAPQDGFYHPVTWKGAFRGMNWASDWTFLSQRGILTAKGGGNPLPAPQAATVGPTAPQIDVEQTATGFRMSFIGVTGVTYQVQRRTVLIGAEWMSEGAAVVGTGAPISVDVVTDLDQGYFRVLAQ